MAPYGFYYVLNFDDSIYEQFTVRLFMLKEIKMIMSEA